MKWVCSKGTASDTSKSVRLSQNWDYNQLHSKVLHLGCMYVMCVLIRKPSVFGVSIISVCFVCLYVCVCVFACVCLYVCVVRICVFVCVFVCVRVPISTHFQGDPEHTLESLEFLEYPLFVCLCVFVCVYVCMCVFVCECLCVYVYVCAFVCVVCDVGACVFVCVFVCVCVFECAFVCVCVCV